MLFLAVLPSRRGAGSRHQPLSQPHRCWGGWSRAGLGGVGRTSLEALAAAWGAWGLAGGWSRVWIGHQPFEWASAAPVLPPGQFPRVGLVPSVCDLLAGSSIPAPAQPGAAQGCVHPRVLAVSHGADRLHRAHGNPAAGRMATTGLLLQHQGPSRQLAPSASYLVVDGELDTARNQAPHWWPQGQCWRLQPQPWQG